jgi:hypothetical protein
MHFMVGLAHWSSHASLDNTTATAVLEPLAWIRAMDNFLVFATTATGAMDVHAERGMSVTVDSM